MAMYMALFPYLVSDLSFTVLYLPLVHILQYATLFNTKLGKYATCDTVIHFFCGAGLKETVEGQARAKNVFVLTRLVFFMYQRFHTFLTTGLTALCPVKEFMSYHSSGLKASKNKPLSFFSLNNRLKYVPFYAAAHNALSIESLTSLCIFRGANSCFYTI